MIKNFKSLFLSAFVLSVCFALSNVSASVLPTESIGETEEEEEEEKSTFFTTAKNVAVRVAYVAINTALTTGGSVIGATVDVAATIIGGATMGVARSVVAGATVSGAIAISAIAGTNAGKGVDDGKLNIITFGSVFTGIGGCSSYFINGFVNQIVINNPAVINFINTIAPVYPIIVNPFTTIAVGAVAVGAVAGIAYGINYVVGGYLVSGRPTQINNYTHSGGTGGQLGTRLTQELRNHREHKML
ncbi:hypothetical protein FACS1894152_2030 [Bacilli bacterium]|nr:hypothetical protein FACS1894152_2030 [Bacilli bacterium]